MATGTYGAIYLGGSSLRMTLPTLRKLASLVMGGATLVGVKPEADPSPNGGAREWGALAGQLWPASETALVG